MAAPPHSVFPNYTEMRSHLPVATWHGLRAVSVIVALLLGVLLFTRPDTGLLLFWGLLVPVLPLLFFLAPGLWRNVCPLAAVNQTPRVLGFTRALTLPNWLREYSFVIGISLFFLLAASRKLIFNTSGPATALLLLGALLAAFLGGVLLKGKSGWCSSVCPLLPVQRIYGQTPFLVERNSHCNPCVGCTRNCYDFSPHVAYVADMYDEDPHHRAYRRFFVGAFPGFVLAFYQVPTPPTVSALSMYLQFALYILVSAGVFFALDAFLKVTPNRLPVLFGSLALNFYYWYTVPALGQLWGIDLPAELIWAARLALLAATAVWIVRTNRKEAIYVAQMLPSSLALATVGSTKARAQGAASEFDRAEVTFLPQEQRVVVEMGRTVLETAEKAGLPIEAGCRMGVCGADPVAILEGIENLSPIGADERNTLERLGLADNTRMACRARVQGQVCVSLQPERRGRSTPVTVPGLRYDPAVRRIVILGAGIAGVTAADHIRRRHPDCEIHLVGREKHYLYNRMGISRLIYGRSAMQGLYLMPEAWYEEHRITCWINTRAVRIDRQVSQVELATGETLPYDRLILATGSRSFVPAIEGLHLAGAFTLRDADDAMQIRAFAQEHGCRQAVVAGGGLLGLEAAYALHQLSLAVMVLERSERLLSRQLDRRGAQILRDHLEQLGLQIVLRAETAAVLGQDQFAELLVEMPALKEFLGGEPTGTGRVRQVLLKDGRTLPCDLFLVAAGVRPNVELAAEAGLTVNRGVVVDAAMQSSDPAIFAAGDVAEYKGEVSGLWPPAVDQAQVAAINAVGGEATYTAAVPTTMLKVVGVDLTSVGQFEARSDNEIVIALEEVVEDSDQRRYRKLVITDGHIVGAILLGYPIEAPLVSAAIKQGVNVMPFLAALRAGQWDILNRFVQV